MKKQLLTFTIALGLIAPVSSAFALNSNFDAMAEAGSHKFYVWCTGKDDYEASQEGTNAKEAQAALAAKAGKKCWPVWQGKE